MQRYEPTKTLTISEITRDIRILLERNFHTLWIVGEISNFRTPGSGHWYFTLKDDKAQLATVMFRGQNRYLKFHPEDGTEVVVRGRITVYEPRGQYQFVAEHMEPKGMGALQIAFDQLRSKLEQEGLFSPERKRPLPFLPRRIGLITSISGAVVRDICNVLFRRNPAAHLTIHPVRVQGEGAAAEIVRAIDAFARRGDVDVLILARGGGSIEDLWAFNEEPLARAIATCPIPTISAVGHETDFTIADFVADVRAPTPSAAAELVMPVRAELVERIRTLDIRLARQTMGQVTAGRVRVQQLRQVIEDPRLALAGFRRRIDEAEESLLAALREPLMAGHRQLQDLERRLWAESPRARAGVLRARLGALSQSLLGSGPRHARSGRERLMALSGQLNALSPLAVLSRGYAVASLPDGALLKDASDAPVGTEIQVRLHKGRLETRVTRSRPE